MGRKFFASPSPQPVGAPVEVDELQLKSLAPVSGPTCPCPIPHGHRAERRRSPRGHHRPHSSLNPFNRNRDASKAEHIACRNTAFLLC